MIIDSRHIYTLPLTLLNHTYTMPHIQYGHTYTMALMLLKHTQLCHSFNLGILTSCSLGIPCQASLHNALYSKHACAMLLMLSRHTMPGIIPCIPLFSSISQEDEALKLETLLGINCTRCSESRGTKTPELREKKIRPRE